MTGYVKPCSECGGEGEAPNGHGKGGNDPDSWTVRCQACEGNGYFPCEACGNTVHIDGYDCFVCDPMVNIGRALSDAEIAAMVKAFGEALLTASKWNEENVPMRITVKPVDVTDEAEFPEIALVRRHYEGLSPERKAELDKEWEQ